jgi:hypothetical protein
VVRVSKSRLSAGIRPGVLIAGIAIVAAELILPLLKIKRHPRIGNGARCREPPPKLVIRMNGSRFSHDPICGGIRTTNFSSQPDGGIL